MSLANKFDELLQLVSKSRRERINDRVHPGEIPDPVPLEIPVELRGPPTTRELVQQYVAEAVSAQAVEDGYGSFEEEDDFEIPDETLLDLSGYEVIEIPMEDEAPPDAAPPEPAPAPPEPSAGSPGDVPPPAAVVTEPPASQEP